ncbi:rod shape-determining protein MreC [Patescibacteria group bacterium]|nr:rod shape-determining protein MreC [Patescibacteria group bacterium]
MKKQSFRRHSAVSLLSPTVRTAGVIVLVVILLLAIIRFVFPGSLMALATPFWNLSSTLTGGVGGIMDSFGNTRMLTEDHDRLLEENIALSAEVAELEARLADVEGLVDTPEGILAGVLARPPIAPYDVLILGAGTEAGIREGHLVYGNGGVPIGVIRSLSEGNARAALFSEAGRETPGWVGADRIPVSVSGTGAGTFRMTVAKDSGILVGDVVYLPGPGALPIGFVSRVETDPSSPDARVHVFPYTNPFTLSVVRVGPHLLP